MADVEQNFSEFWKTQKSLTEWLSDITHADTEAIRKEDNDKRDRLARLHTIIGLPFDQPTQFTGRELADFTPDVQGYIKEHGEELCALRLMPLSPALPKLRMRGKTVREAYEWFKELDIDPADYKADFLGQEKESRWATIFVVNQHGIFGEVIYGKHYQLTQGFHQTDKPKLFQYDFTKWQIEPADDSALAHVKQLAEYLHIDSTEQREQIAEQLDGSFSHDYLKGYFETVDSVDFGTWFIDYSPSLGKMYADLQLSTADGDSKSLVHGQPGASGTASGPVCIVDPEQIDNDFPDGAVLVCSVTTPAYVPLMKRAAAIVTDQGGILSHAAIVARELKIPCIVGTGNATTILQNGQQIRIDATNGGVFLAD